MSEPPERFRRKPTLDRRGGWTLYGTVGVFLFLSPLVLAITKFDTLVGVEIFLTLLLIVGLNAIFVSSETALELIRSTHIRQASTDEKRSKILQGVQAHKSLLIAACFLGSQTMRAWLILLTIPIAMSNSEFLAKQLNIGDSWVSVLATGFLIGIPVVAFNVVFGELVPRSFAVANPVRAVTWSYGFVRIFATVFKPFAMGFLAVGGLLTKRFGARASFSIGNQAEEEIKERLEQAVETQEIEEEEKDMLHSVFEFGDTVAREIMTPRVDMDAVSIETTLTEIAKVVEDSGHSRIPVFEGSDDQIVGIIHAKDVLSAINKGRKLGSIRTILRPAHFVPENKSLHDLLQEMRMAKTQLVIVQDEFGGTAGVVTVEDIVEEVVGEIVDEYDIEEPAIVKNSNGFIIEGRTNLYDVNDEIGTNFESDEFDTIGGYVFGLFGRQPDLGEYVEDAGYKFLIWKTDGRRIESVEVSKIELESKSDILDKITEGLSS